MGAGGAPQTATANTITLKGSAQIVSEFFDFAVNRCAAPLEYALRERVNN